MQITKDTVVSLSYQLFDTEGTLLDATPDGEAMVYLHGGYDGIFPLVEEALQGKSVGDVLDVALDTDNAFGDYDVELVRTEALESLPPEIEVGMVLEADDPEYGMILFTITDIADGEAVLDGNHPLAGKDIQFKATVKEVRKATADEIAHGHAHGAGGHQH